MRNFNFFRGLIGARVVSIGGALNELDRIEPIRPDDISNRHWNMLPDYIRNGGDLEVVSAYIDGWESPPDADAYVLYRNNFNLINTWSMGRIARQRRRNPTMLQPTDTEYYDTDDFIFIDVTEIRYDYNDGQPYKVMIFRHIETGEVIQGNIINSEHPMWNFPDVM